MSYIGNTNTTQAFTPAVDFFNGDGSTVAFTLSKPVASVAQVQAVISNVPQNPGSAFTVSGNTITFTSAPPSGTSNIYVYYTSPITQVIAPGQGTVTTTSLMDGSVTPAKLSTGGPSWDTSGNVTLTGNITLNNGTADGAQLTLSSSGYSDWNIDNYSGNFRWYYNATEYMRLSNSGNLGLGVTPSAWLTSYSNKAMQIGPVGAIYGNTVSSSNQQMAVANNLYLDSSANTRYITSDTASRYIQYAGQHRWDICASGTAGGLASLTQAMTLDSSGNLLVGATSTTQSHKMVGLVANAWSLQVFSTFATGSQNYGIQVAYTNAAPNSTVAWFYQGVDNSAGRFTVYSNGGIANYQANNTNLSDRREKTNFAAAGNYLEKICAIPVQTFNYIDQNLEEDGGLTLGVVAQDVQAVAPELVMESNWGTQEEPKMRLSVYQTDLQYALMKCIQEQQAIIETLTNRITALENK